jgi:hypothetical protein
VTERAAIELNDTSVIVHDGSRIIHESPGYIVDTGKQEWIGKEAHKRAYLYSNQCENKFWSEIARAESNLVRQADVTLAMRHLTSIWQHVADQINAVVLVVPGSFSKTGLGILLGLCKELNIPVQAMVHKAVLCPHQLDHAGDTAHVDIQLHHTVITPLHTLDEDHVVGDVKVLHGMGIIKLHTQVAEFIAQAFINKTRLDPMHSADLEQQLYDHLPRWLQDSQHNDVVVCNFEYQDKAFELIVNSTELHNIYDAYINNIVNAVRSVSTGQNIIACLTDAIDSQIGFSRGAHKHGLKVRALDAAYFARQSFAYNEEISTVDNQVYLIKQLPYTLLSDPLASPVVSKQNYVKPDHVLYRHHAYQIKDIIMLVINRQDDYELQYNQADADEVTLTLRDNLTEVYIEPDQTYAIEVNGQLVQSYCKLSVGDSIKVPGCEDVLTLIKVDN